MQRPDTLAFAPRKESWVASACGWFYKIFRASDDPARDWLDPVCCAKAAREHADMLFLHGISRRVCRPAQLDHACIVYPYLSGPDLRVLLQKRDRLPGDTAAALRAAVTLLARLHAATTSGQAYPDKDYTRQVYVPPGASIAERIAVRKRTLFVGGFEVRNFRFDHSAGEWVFFDPQHMYMGMAEDDLARFIISLLMVNWGRGGSLKIWQGFTARDLLDTYETVSGRRVDTVLLRYFLDDTIAMRRFFAEKALRAMAGAKRVLGRVYLTSYFRQLDHWVVTHEL